MFLSILAGIATFLSVTGAFLGARGKPFKMNVIWLVANLMWIYLAIVEGSSTLMLFVVYQIIAIYGVVNLWSQRREL